MDNKTVLVTGASRGIGKDIAIYFAKQGYNVAINCYNKAYLLEEVKKEIETYNVKCFSYLGDISKYDIVTNIYENILKELGHIDVLINNAGISHIGLLTDMKPNEWKNIIDINLTSVFNCCSVILPEMINKKSGRIINISSVWGIVGASMEVAYSASKGGLNAFTKALAKEVAPSGIQVNAIACGAIATEMNAFLDDNDMDVLINEIPTCRLGSTKEVANLAFYLANSNKYLTGQIINLDGGWI
ncbi:MAG TPA: 3-oxoacyl-ACP reductase FabG [Clostridiales bacterium]|nr:3-oxoacyl-ACP reductase FabG [Clostridiales bacterium]